MRMSENLDLELCPCGSDQDYKQCCGALHLGQRKAQSAEELMRSRYAAYVKGEIDYLLETTDPGTRRYYSRNSIENWSKNVHWLGLEVVHVSEKRVRFIATYLDENRMLCKHREDSTFSCKQGTWFFVDGKDF